MLWLTEDASLVCDHGGAVSIVGTQELVRIEKRRALIHPNPEGRPISHCTNNLPVAGILPCLHTLPPRDGYSTFVRIEGERVCLKSLLGYTDGSPPLTSNYKVVDAAQTFVEADG